MIVLVRALALVGWRGGIALVAGALVAAMPAYKAGQLLEARVCKERIVRSLAEHDLRRMELENGRIADAQAARVRAGVQRADGTRGMPDDGFRRD